MSVIRLGMIGAGLTARWHLRAYRRIAGVRVVAIANPRSPRGAGLARSFGIPEHYASGAELIARAPIDAVDICAPTGEHAPLLRAALDRGLHVYVEKPLCATAADAAEVISRNRQAQRVIFNGFNYRYLPEFIRLQRLLAGGRLGEIRYVRLFRTTMEPPGSGLLTDPALDLFREFHCHFIDLLFSFGLGEPAAVAADGVCVHDWLPSPDTATVTLRYPSGALAELTVSVAAPGLTPELTVIGTKGTATLRYGRVRVVPHRREWSLLRRLRLLADEAFTLPWRVLRNPFLPACRHFCSCVAAGRPSPCDEHAAWRVLRIAETAAAGRRIS